jgi:PAS domain S-box-containing protein
VINSFIKSIKLATYSLFLITSCLSNINAAETSKTENNDYLTDQERAWLTAHPVLKVHNESNWVPFNFNDNGKPAGFSVDYMNLLAEIAGFQIKYINGPSWNDFLGMMKDGQLDVMLNIVKTTEREEYLAFTSPYAVVSPVLVIRNDDKDIFALEDMGDKTLCLPKGSSTHEYLSKNHPQMKLRPLEDALACLQAVQNHRVDVALDGDAILNSIFSRNNIKGLRISKVAVDPAMSSVLRLATRKDSLILRDILEKTKKQLDDEKVSQLHQKWLDSNTTEAEVKESSANTDELIIDIAMWAVIIIAILFVLTYFSKKMASNDNTGIQTGTRQFRFLLLITLSIFIGSISLLGWQDMSKIKSKILIDLDNNLRTILVTTEERLINWVNQEQSSLEQIANNPLLAIETEKLLKLEQSKSVLVAAKEQENIRKILKPDSNYLGLGYFIINKVGTSIASRRDSNIGSINLIAIQRPGLLEKVYSGQSIFIPPVYSDIADDKHNSSLFIAVPIKNKDNEVIAVLTKRLNPANKFSQVLHYSRVGESGETYAFDKNATLLSASRFDDHLREIGLIKYSQQSLMNIEIKDPGVKLLESKQKNHPKKLPLTLMAESAIKLSSKTPNLGKEIGQKVETNLDGYRDYRGVPVVGAWLWNSQLGIGLTSEMDVEEALSIYSKIQTSALLGFSITLFFIITGTFFILIMGEKTSRITNRAKKDLEDQVEERTKDLKVAEEKSRAIVANSQDAIIVINDGSIIMSWNKAAESIFGYLTDDIVGKSIKTIIPPEYHTAHSEGVDLFIKTKKNKMIDKGTVEITAINSNGGILPIEMALSTFEIDGDNFFSANIRDITKRLEAERETKQAKEQAEDANKAKSTFLANMSHELRTPMNAIIGYSEMLIEDAEDDENDEIIPDLSKINSAGRHLLALINDILDLSKIEAGKMELFLEDLNLKELVQEVIDTSKPLTEKNHNVVNLIFDNDIEIIHGDAMKIKQSMFNLISNAAKFTDNGEIGITVSKTKVNGIDFLDIAVSDSGIGIPEDKLDTVFEEFSQADDSTTKDYGGTGLGLPLSVKFCKMMDGDLTVTSEVGKGSVFTISIPIHVVDEEREPEKIASDKIELSNDYKNTVLIIDDDENSRDILTRYLEKEGYTVYQANDSDSGIQLAEEHKPDVITLDIMMPDKDGWSTLQSLKDNSVTEKIPVIMVSIVADKETAITLGAVDALMKPIDKKLLVDAVKRHLKANSNQNILIVDDDQVNRDLIKRYLDEDVLNLHEATNGAEALDFLENVTPDLILLDLMMPVMDGFEFLEKIKVIEAYSLIPIIIVTSKSLGRDELEFLNNHTLAVLQKGDLTKSDLNQKLKAILT